MHLTLVVSTPASPIGDDHWLGDLAHEIMFAALDMAEDPDQAARAMLIAVASLTHGDPTFGRAIDTSTALLTTIRRALDQLALDPAT